MGYPGWGMQAGADNPIPQDVYLCLRNSLEMCFKYVYIVQYKSIYFEIIDFHLFQSCVASIR